jgi:CubicO group peptidase (beta-lactamase class C family)
MTYRAQIAAFAALIALSGCSSDSTSNAKGGLGAADGGGTNAPKLDFAKFDAAVEAFLTQNGLKGASAVVVHKDLGIVHTSGYGAYPADRKYLVASSSKIVSVGVLMRLADQGLLDIDAPISKYLGASDAGKADLEVAQLVSNSSGLVSLTDNPLYGPYLCQYVDTGSLSGCAKSVYTATDAADKQPPDSSFHYGGGPWQLAGGVAEAASGKSWRELIQETYVDTCGAGSFGYGNQFSQALGTAGDGGGLAAALTYPPFFKGDPANLHPTENPSIEGGLYTTAEDYGKILLMHLRGGTCGQTRVLTESAVLRMQEDRIAKKYNGTTGNPALAGYGLGWWIDRTNVGVFADPGAYGAFPWLDLSRDYAAFLVIEAGTDVGGKLFTAVKPTLDDVFDAVKK